MDTITITELEVWTYIGVPDEERAQEQRLLVSVTLCLDTKQAAATDDISSSIDYQQVTHDVRALAKVARKTIECFAKDIADTILKKYQPKQVDISVQKFVIPGTKNVMLTISRSL